MRHYQPGIEVPAGEVVERGWNYCDHLASESAFVVTNLRQSWGRHGESDISELASMWYASDLVDTCKQAFVLPGEPEHDIHRLIGLHPDAKTRYEAEAALATIARFDVTMEPYRLALKRLPLTGSLEAICRAMSEHEPDTVQAWHDWLWQPGASLTDYGEASLFAIASAQLAQSMEAVLSLDI
jgi:hypothetical protein